ncbi:hypothetical protein B0H21DRAFT_705734 [Amylocystis lapponica]|nr:hypothetical protein B0H21DRAFT_705734 [Amylocystis lapponica]
MPGTERTVGPLPDFHPAPLALPVPPVNLLLADYFMDTDDTGSSHLKPDTDVPGSDPFAEVYMDEDSKYVDYNGSKIMFSAGTTRSDKDTHDLMQQLDNIRNDQIIEERNIETDMTVPDIVAAMHAMGETSQPLADIGTHSCNPGIEDSDKKNEDDIEHMFDDLEPIRKNSD